MRYLLYLPGIILLLLPVLSASYANYTQREKEREKAAAAEQRRIEAEAKAAEKKAAAEQKRIEAEARAAAKREAAEARRREREARQAAAHALKVARAKELAELAERRLQAEQALAEMRKQPAERTGSIPAEPEQAEPEAETGGQEPAQAPKPAPIVKRIKGNNAFAGHRVAFTGKLPGMTRREAIQAVEANGGRGYEKMPVGTTLLVVGDKPGMGKMDKADEWIGQVRKITAAQFFEMLNQPLELELEELEAMFAARFAA